MNEEATIKLDKLQLEHENEWVALDPMTKKFLGSHESLPTLMRLLPKSKQAEGPILFKVPTGEASLSPTSYEV